MIVSWDWLKHYVPLDCTVDAFAERMMMAGLNHESTEAVGSDWAVDLEVTSNRPDCLGHIGIAREASVLWDRKLTIPAAQPAEVDRAVTQSAQVRIECPELCLRYTARVIRGVNVGPSPAWLRDRLATVGIASINNVVDVTNYVLMECGQPLHAFDLGKLQGSQIIVRQPRAGEKLVAIDHKTYELAPGMCVIADQNRAVGLGGVMGGAETEVTHATKDLLIEAAQFDPVAIRTAARKLNLHSDASYRFERGTDPAGVDWASRRCCELILQVAGGVLEHGVIDVGTSPAEAPQITLRLSQIERLLGIAIDGAEVRRILAALGNRIVSHDANSVTVVPPSWRRDLSREIDLIEEVARIHGYDAIPENVRVPMFASAKSNDDRVLERIRRVMSAAGYDEAYTLSVVEEESVLAFSPWTSAAPIVAQTPVMRRADRLRRSLVPSLLAARRTNEGLANPRIELFEIAKCYLPQTSGLPQEDLLLALTSGHDFLTVKGQIETLVAQLNPSAQVQSKGTDLDYFAGEPAAELQLDGKVLGYIGQVQPAVLKQLELRQPTTVAELRVAVLQEVAQLVPQYRRLSPYPAVTRDLNLVVEDSIRWADLDRVIRDSAGPLLESLSYVETYRSPALGQSKKSLLLALVFRSEEATLTNQEVDRLRDGIVAACQTQCQAQLRA
jgi:phenylalanyl-tRNA synthetase beta chain